MTNQNKYSRLIHIVTMLSFLLPFFFNGCGQTAAKKKKAEDKRIQDSIENAQKYFDSTHVNLNQPDTIRQIKISQVDTVKKQMSTNHADTIKNNADKKSEYLSEEISKKYSFLSSILIPKADIHTGLATVIDTFRYINYFAIFISLLLLIISLTIKFVDVDAKKAIGLLDTIALIFLAITQSAFITSETLWGYWVCLTALICLTVYDLYLILLDKRLTKRK